MEKRNISDIRFYLGKKRKQGGNPNKEGRLIHLQERLVESCLEVEQGSREFYRRLGRAKRFGGDPLVDEVARRRMYED